jgi:hypothetical protein
MGTLAGRITRSRSMRVFFLGLATLAAALGFPVKVEPPPRRPTPAGIVRDDDDDEERSVRSTGVR